MLSVIRLLFANSVWNFGKALWLINLYLSLLARILENTLPRFSGSEIRYKLDIQFSSPVEFFPVFLFLKYVY
jgi:hypothetical protein